jgi:hypothetical protein
MQSRQSWTISGEDNPQLLRNNDQLKGLQINSKVYTQQQVNGKNNYRDPLLPFDFA